MNKEKTAYKVLLKLTDGRFHSGQALGEALGMTRSAIWKAVQQLEHLGLPIQSVSGKGYRILGGLTLLDSKATSQEIHEKLDHLILLDQVKSTNDYLLTLPQNQAHQTIACLAEQQTAGKGRRGRTWTSPFGTNLYCSLLWHLNKDPSETSGLSLATALAVIRTLKQYGITDDLKLKWPNDVLWENKKLSGILIEMRAVSHDQSHLVIGVGINTQMTSIQAQTIDQDWVSIHDITEQSVDRNRLAGILINELLLMLKKFETAPLSELLKDWNQYDAFLGKSIQLSSNNTTIAGISRGIGENGELLIELASGEIKHIMTGDVSLRKI